MHLVSRVRGPRSLPPFFGLLEIVSVDPLLGFADCDDHDMFELSPRALRMHADFDSSK